MGAGFFAPLMNELWGGDCCCELLQRRFVRQSARDKVNKHPLAGVDRPCAKVARRLLGTHCYRSPLGRLPRQL